MRLVTIKECGCDSHKIGFVQTPDNARIALPSQISLQTKVPRDKITNEDFEAWASGNPPCVETTSGRHFVIAIAAIAVHGQKDEKYCVKSTIATIPGSQQSKNLPARL